VTCALYSYLKVLRGTPYSVRTYAYLQYVRFKERWGSNGWRRVLYVVLRTLSHVQTHLRCPGSVELCTCSVGLIRIHIGTTSYSAGRYGVHT
jgi:hypothetical protein